MGHAIRERARMFGTQSADYITASGHSGRIVTEASLQAKTGRIHDRTRTLRKKSQICSCTAATNGMDPALPARSNVGRELQRGEWSCRSFR
jgi:hypothetical protein